MIRLHLKWMTDGLSNQDDLSVYRKTHEQPLPPNFDFAAWRTKHDAFAKENVPRWAAAVKEQFGNERTKIAVVGYCFGAPYVCNLLATDTVSAGAFAHPTLLKEEHFTSIKKPLLLSCAEEDHAFPPELRRKALDLLQRDKKIYHLQLFQGVSHGFATKADLNDPYQCQYHRSTIIDETFIDHLTLVTAVLVWCKEQSIRAIIDWFNLWLSRP